MRSRLAGIAAALACALAAFAAQVSRSERIAGTELRFKVILPPDYDASKEYPAVIAFPGGAQNMPMVDGMIARNWRAQAEQRGYIVVVASAPAEGLFYQGGAKVFPGFLDKLLSDYKVRGGKFHIAGISNGGISAFSVAAAYPGYFYSVTGFPGYLPDLTPERADALKGLCLNLHVGELDSGWASTMAEQADIFRARGLKVRFTIEPGQGHVMRTLENAGAARLFDQFEEAREGCR